MRISSVATSPRFCSVRSVSVRASGFTEYSFSVRAVAVRGRTRDLEPHLQLVQPADVFRDLLGRGDLAVQAAAALLGDVLAEEVPPLALAERLLQGGRRAVLPGRDQRRGQLLRGLRVQRVLEELGVEVEEEQADRAQVLGGC